MNYNYYVYILTNKYRTVFYTGVTNDLFRRVIEHKIKINEGFTNDYNVNLQGIFFANIKGDPGSRPGRQGKMHVYDEKKTWIHLDGGLRGAGGAFCGCFCVRAVLGRL